jgi:uncharacterized protein YwbE
MDASKKNLFCRAIKMVLTLALMAELQTRAQVTNNVSPNGTSSFIINGQNNPTLTLTRGVTYVFQLTGLSIHPFYIKTNLTTGSANVWTAGVVNNGSTSANVVFTVPTTPLPPALTNTLFYHCGNHAAMGGLLPIVDPPPGPQLVKIVYITVSNNIVINSLGTNTWSVTPLCNSNLTSTNWVAIPNFSNSFTNGTNITTFGRTNVDVICGPGNPAFFRIRQQFP